MLRFFKQYYPIRNIFFVIGEGLFIYISVLVATWILINPESFPLGELLSRKAFLIAFVCMICLYFNDVYDLQITNSYLELGIRLFQALGASSIILDKASNVSIGTDNVLVQRQVSEAMASLVNLMINVSQDVKNGISSDMINAVDLNARVNFVAFSMGVSIDLAALTKIKSEEKLKQDT